MERTKTSTAIRSHQKGLTSDSPAYTEDQKKPYLIYGIKD